MSTRRPRVRGWPLLVALYVAAVAFMLLALVKAIADDRRTSTYLLVGQLMLWIWLGSRAWKGRGADPS